MHDQRSARARGSPKTGVFLSSIFRLDAAAKRLIIASANVGGGDLEGFGSVATLKEIAARAGVSIRTVTRVLAGAADVNAATRERIGKIARELDYRPNQLARGLKLRRSHIVAAIVHRPDELAFEKVCALERELRKANLVVQLVFNAGGAAEEAGLLAEALAHHAAAVAVFTAAGSAGEAGHLEALHKSGHPYVLVDRQPSPRLDTILIDRAAGIAGAVGKLLDGGHRKVFYLGPEGPERIEGFLRAFRERSLRPPSGWRMTEGWEVSDESARRAGLALLERAPEATAVFAYSDIFAYGVMRGLAERGAGVPERVSVLGFDDRSPSRYVSPPLSTVAHPHEEVGKLAAEVLLGKLGGKIRAGQGTRTAVPRYVERQSTRDLG
jgi:LacI family transcriptional regulator